MPQQVTATRAHAQLQTPGRWLTQKFAPVPAPEEEYWNAVANGKVYLMGGNQGGANDRVLEYDMAADRWTTKKPAPFSANHMALVEYRGKVYVFGGATVESQVLPVMTLRTNASSRNDAADRVPRSRAVSVCTFTGGTPVPRGGFQPVQSLQAAFDGSRSIGKSLTILERLK